METQKKQVTKSNRTTLPFYSPPSRHYGQTPSEIIREARASVMSSLSTGIKPVVTSRPFTPKENERTLFGNVKKRLSRPPSSFSLSYLQKPEALPRIKLPAIASNSKKRVDSNSNIRTVHSLDNLIEEYETEDFDEKKRLDFKKFPAFRDSHSSPQERRVSHSVSLNDKISTKVPEKRSIYTISQGRTENLISYAADDTYYDYINNSDRYTSELSKIGCVKTRDKLQNESEFMEDSEKYTDLDHAVVVVGKDSPAESSFFVENLVNENENVNVSEGQKQILDNSKEDAGDVLQNKTSTETEEQCEKDNLVKERFLPEDHNYERHNIREKSVETEVASKYLTLINNRAKDSMGCDDCKAKEILDLYETAQYYGVFENTGEENAQNIQNIDTKQKKNDNSDYLEAVKENIKKFDLRMRKLNESIETFEEKLNGRNSIYSSNGNSSAHKMNDAKRHHVQRDGKETKLEDDLWHTKSDTRRAGWDGFWKNSYYRQSGETENLDEQSVLKSLEHRLGVLLKISKVDKREITKITDEMYKLMKRWELMEKQIMDSEMKINILRSLYNFADTEESEILLSLARIIFALKMETSLSVACKMVFKVARSDENDNLFLEMDDILELFLEGIGRASPLDAAECCIYGYGALKFLTMNHRILSRLISLGVLDLLILHIKIIISAKVDGHVVNEQTQHALFQLTGALRNIAAGEGVLPLFITTNSIPVLCKVLNCFRQSEDLVTNVSRTLSLISADEDSTDILISVENILPTIIELMDLYKCNDKILIRLSYCLGNIVAYSDLARVQLSRSESSLAVLLKILELYSEKDLKLSMNDSTTADCDGMDGEAIDDIIVKVIRIIANMCMNPVVGSNLSPSEGNEKNSLKLSQLLTTLLKRKDPGITLLASLGCLNNISYYCGNHSSLIDVTEGVIRVLSLHDEECQAEAARVLGNLTRHKEIRDLISSTGGVDLLSKLLDSKDKNVYRCACGALVNLMLDYENRKAFAESHGLDKLVEGLERFSGDWSFSALICRAIWNSCADDLDIVMSHNNVEKLLNVLANSLDEENWNDGDSAWEEFAVLATDLLEKINAHLEL